MRTYTRFDASDFEDGVIIFKKVTTDGVEFFVQMTAEELQTELGAVDPNNYDANTILFIEDDGSGTNNIVSPQSAAEIKTLLGISEYPRVIYFGYLAQTGTGAPTVSASHINTAVIGTPTRSGAGSYTIPFTSVPYPKCFIQIQVLSGAGRFEIYYFSNTLYVSQKDKDGNGVDVFTIELLITEITT